MIDLEIWENEFSASSLVADMDEAGVERVLICAQKGGSWRVTHEDTKSMVDQYRSTLCTAGIDPRDIVAAFGAPGGGK